MKQIIDLLLNQNLSVVDNIVIWVNLIFSFIAGGFSFEASKSGILGLRNSFKLVAGLAWLYSFSYFVLLISDINFLSWSSVMRGVSILVWFIVWTLPALMSIKLWKRLERSIKSSVNKSEGIE